MFISHVAAVHNEERWIAAMIESWQSEASAFPGSAELVIVNDHSTDNTERIAREFAAKDDRISVWSLGENASGRGKVAAFNLGVRQSRGDFVGLIAGDDLMAPGTLTVWAQALSGSKLDEKVAAFARLRTMSEDPKADGMVIPRRPVGNRSGGTSVFSRSLADILFPIPEELPSEDIWTAYLLKFSAERVVEVPEVVLFYRIHPGNSNPRALGFKQMSEAMHKRAKAYDLLLSDPRIPLTEDQMAQLTTSIELERRRVSEDLVGVLRAPRASVVARLRVATMTKPWIWSVRQRLFRAMSGW